MRPDPVYRSKIDPWLMAGVFLAAALPFLAAIWLRSQGMHRGTVLLFGWGLLMPAGIALVSLPMRYTLRTDRLQIQSGVMEWDIPLAWVREVRAVRNLLPGPAWSIHRLRLGLSDGSCILVSPDDPESFIREIAARSPHLDRDPPPESRPS